MVGITARFPLFLSNTHIHRSPAVPYPQSIELLRTEGITPGRHLILSSRDRAQESIALLRRKFPQIEGTLRSLHARTMARRAVDRKQLRPFADLIRLRSPVHLRRIPLCSSTEEGQPPGYLALF